MEDGEALIESKLKPKTIEEVYMGKSRPFMLPSEGKSRPVTQAARLKSMSSKEFLTEYSVPYDISYRRNKENKEYVQKEPFPKDLDPNIVNVIEHYKKPNKSLKRIYAQKLLDELNQSERSTSIEEDNDVISSVEKVQKSIAAHKKAMEAFVSSSSKLEPERTDLIQRITNHYESLSLEIPKICEAFKEDIEKANKDLEESRLGHDPLRRQKNELEAAIDKQNRSIYTMRQQLEDYRSKCSATEARLRDATNEKMAVIRNSQSNKDKLKQLTQEIEEKENQTKSIKAMMEVLNGNLESTAKQLETTTNNIKNLEDHLDNIEDENQKLEEYVTQAAEEIENLKNEADISPKKESRKDFGIQVTILQEQIQKEKKHKQKQTSGSGKKKGLPSTTREEFQQNKSDLSEIQQIFGDNVVIKNKEDLRKIRDIILRNNNIFDWSAHSISRARVGNFPTKNSTTDEARLYASWFVSRAIQRAAKCVTKVDIGVETESSADERRRRLSFLSGRKSGATGRSGRSGKSGVSGRSGKSGRTGRTGRNGKGGEGGQFGGKFGGKFGGTGASGGIGGIGGGIRDSGRNGLNTLGDLAFMEEDEEEDFLYESEEPEKTIAFKNARLAKLLSKDFSNRRPKTIDWLIHSIRSIYDEKYVDDQTEVLELDQYVMKWAFRQFGREDLIQKGCWDLLISSYYHMQRSLEVMLFVRFLDGMWTLDQLCFFLKSRVWIMKRCVTIAIQNDSVDQYLTETFLTRSQVTEYFRIFCPDTEPDLIEDLNIRSFNCADPKRGGLDSSNIPMMRVLEIAVGEKEAKQIRRLRKMLAKYRIVPRMTNKRFVQFVRSILPNVDINMIDSLYHSSQVQNSLRVDIDLDKFAEKFKNGEDDDDIEDFMQYSPQYALTYSRWEHFQPFLLKIIDQINEIPGNDGKMLVNEIRHNMFQMLEAKVAYDGKLFFENYHKLLQSVLFACMKFNLPDSYVFQKQTSDFEKRLIDKYQQANSDSRSTSTTGTDA